MSNYKFVIIPLITLIICQIIKFVIESIECKELKWGRLFNGSGGMPSSHTSLVISITVMNGINYGFDSALFATSLVFSLIVLYDAMGLRMESGKQAIAINIILDKIFYKGGLKHLKEELGHKPIEVLMGIVLGITVPLIYNWII